MDFSVTILGSSSALPTSGRYPTAQVLNASGRFFLIDCGEGTQLQLRKYKIRLAGINNIFISHLHGDHCFGLIGLISTYGLLGRDNDLNIHAHPDLETILQPQIDYFCDGLPFKVIFNHLDPGCRHVAYSDNNVIVETIPLKHRVPTCGFLFREVINDFHIDRASCNFYNVPVKEIPAIKKGADFIAPDGTVVSNHLLTRSPSPARSFAYCSDTAFTPDLIDIVKDVDLLYHEATFLNQHEKLARATFHSTARNAATIAAKANVKKLAIGHFSARYHDLTAFELESREIFPETHLAREGSVFTVPRVPRSCH